MGRVLIHSIVFFPDSVSTAYIMTDLAHQLKKLGHDVTVLTTTPHYNVETIDAKSQRMERHWGGLIHRSDHGGIPVWHVTIKKKDKRVWKRGLDFVRFHILSLAIGLFVIGRQDAVMATSPPLTIGLVSWLLALRWKAASIYKVAEVYPDLAIRQGVVRHPMLIAALRGIEKLVYSRHTRIVSIAEQFSRALRERGVPEGKLVQIRDSVDVELYRPLPRDNSFAREYGLLGTFVVSYAGNIGLVQDWETVLSSAESLARHPISFVIIGDGVRRQWLVDQIRLRGLTNVRWIGYQPKERMPEVNASCDISIIPMTRTGALDGLPSKIYTIMASGKAVIATADEDSDMAWLIREAGCGRVVAPDDPPALTAAIETAYHDRDVLAAEGENGRRFAMEFTKEAIGLKYDDLIRSLIRDGRPVAAKKRPGILG